jgi:hypothetical protein
MRVGWGGELLFCPTPFSLIAFLRHGSSKVRFKDIDCLCRVEATPVTVLNTLNEGYKRNIGVLLEYFEKTKKHGSTPIFLL